MLQANAFFAILFYFFLRENAIGPWNSSNYKSTKLLRFIFYISDFDDFIFSGKNLLTISFAFRAHLYCEFNYTMSVLIKLLCVQIISALSTEIFLVRTLFGEPCHSIYEAIYNNSQSFDWIMRRSQSRSSQLYELPQRFTRYVQTLLEWYLGH